MNGFQFAVAIACLTLFGFSIATINDGAIISYSRFKRVGIVVLGMFAFVLGVLFLASEAHCTPASQYCENIQDHDARNMCKALSSGNKQFCENIKNKDMKNMCKARVTK
jgi:hypothetical protein